MWLKQILTPKRDCWVSCYRQTTDKEQRHLVITLPLLSLINRIIIAYNHRGNAVNKTSYKENLTSVSLRIILCFFAEPYTTPWWHKLILALCPEHPKRDDEHPHLFHMGVPPPSPPRHLCIYFWSVIHSTNQIHNMVYIRTSHRQNCLRLYSAT